MNAAQDSAGTALVTGANRGIGLEIARQLAQRGWRVFLTARDPVRGREAAAALARELEGGPPAEFLPLDVADFDSIHAAADGFGRKSDRLDALVNNAAVNLDEDGDSILALTPDAFGRTLRANVLGPILVTQAFWPFLRRSRGRVINMSSGAGALHDMEDEMPAYSLSKTALNAVTRQFAAAGRRDAVAVNAVCPGWVRTDMGGENAPRSIAQGADTAVWLATEAPPEVTGKFLRDRREIPW